MFGMMVLGIEHTPFKAVEGGNEMNFEVGERVQVIKDSQLKTGTITIVAGNTVKIEIDNQESYECWNDEVMKINQPKPVKVPKIIADFIKEYEKITCENKQGRDFTRAELLSTIWDSLGTIHADRDIESAWLRENFDKLIEAVMYDYVVNEEQKYYVKVLPGSFGFLNYDKDTEIYYTSTRSEDRLYQTKFTEREIKDISKKIWEFAVPVEEVEESK